MSGAAKAIILEDVVKHLINLCKLVALDASAFPFTKLGARSELQRDDLLWFDAFVVELLKHITSPFVFRCIRASILLLTPLCAIRIELDENGPFILRSSFACGWR